MAGGGDSGDENVPATSAQLSFARAVAVDSAGNLYIAESGNNRIRKVSNGIITTVAGNGTPGFSGDGGAATSAELSDPLDVVVDSSGNLFIADDSNNRVREVSNGTITTVAGGGSSLSDGIPATSALLDSPSGVAVDSSGNLYIASNVYLADALMPIPDSGVTRIRKVSNGVITSIAGGGSSIGDNGPATSAQLGFPSGVLVDSSGDLYIADSSSSRIRKVSNGVITTVAGNGTAGFSGDNGPATSAQLNYPNGVAVDSVGNLYIADTANNRVRKVSNGLITTIAGGGSSLGDNGPAAMAQLNSPNGVAVDASGNLYIADTLNYRIRKVANGNITTVAGTGTQGFVNAFFGIAVPATSASLTYPTGVAVDSMGNLYIADPKEYLILKVSSNGILTNVAGHQVYGTSGDNGPAIYATLGFPFGVAVDSAGNLYIADSRYLFESIRKVSNGIITTIAGRGSSYADDIAATSAQFVPNGVAVDTLGDVYLSDLDTNRVRVLTRPALRPRPPRLSPR